MHIRIRLFTRKGSTNHTQTKAQTNLGDTKNIQKIDRRQNYRHQQNQKIYLRDQRTPKFTKNTTKTNIAACANTIRLKQCFHR